MSASSRPTAAPGLGQGDREIDADRALADPTLARADGDHVLDVGQELLRLARGRAADHRTPGERDVGHADRRQRRPGVALDLVLERAGRCRQLDRERRRRPLDHDVLDHLEGDDVLAELRLLDLAERVEDGAFGERRHRWEPLDRLEAGSRAGFGPSDGRCVDIRIVPRTARTGRRASVRRVRRGPSGRQPNSGQPAAHGRSVRMVDGPARFRTIWRSLTADGCEIRTVESVADAHLAFLTLRCGDTYSRPAARVRRRSSVRQPSVAQTGRVSAGQKRPRPSGVRELPDRSARVA